MGRGETNHFHVRLFDFTSGPNRRYLLVLMTALVFILGPFFGEGNISYLYVRTRYDWSVNDYSLFNSIVSSAGIVGKYTLLGAI